MARRRDTSDVRVFRFMSDLIDYVVSMVVVNQHDVERSLKAAVSAYDAEHAEILARLHFAPLLDFDHVVRDVSVTPRDVGNSVKTESVRPLDVLRKLSYRLKDSTDAIDVACWLYLSNLLDAAEACDEFVDLIADAGCATRDENLDAVRRKLKSSLYGNQLPEV